MHSCFQNLFVSLALHLVNNDNFFLQVESAHLIMNKGSDKEVSVGSDMDGSKTRVIAAVVIICLAVICLILVILLLVSLKIKEFQQKFMKNFLTKTL